MDIERLLHKVRVVRLRGGDNSGSFYTMATSLDEAAEKALAAAEDEWEVQKELPLAGVDDLGPALKVTAVSEVNGVWVP